MAISINSIQPINIKPPAPAAPDTPGAATQSFGAFLGRALDEVNKQQQMADEASKQIALGDVQDIHKALILKQQAGVTLDLTIEIRNKAIEAYQEMMRMSI